MYIRRAMHSYRYLFRVLGNMCCERRPDIFVSPVETAVTINQYKKSREKR